MIQILGTVSPQLTYTPLLSTSFLLDVDDNQTTQCCYANALIDQSLTLSMLREIIINCNKQMHETLKLIKSNFMSQANIFYY